MRRWRRVDLPVPDGPETTMGRSLDNEDGVVGAMVVRVLIWEIEEGRILGCERECGVEVFEAE
jgi:hypothetical protein